MIFDCSTPHQPDTRTERCEYPAFTGRTAHLQESTDHPSVLRTLGVTVLIVITLSLSACSDSSKPNAATSSSSSAATVSHAPAVIKTANAPRTSGYAGALADVTNLTCAQTGSSWAVSGTVTNPTAAPVDYRIFTTFLDSANDTRGLLQTDIKAVPAAESRQWNGELELGATGLRCVLRVERTDAGAP